jgi:hypothetical protein
MTLIMGRRQKDGICYLCSKDFVLETFIYDTEAKMRLLLREVICGPVCGHLT